MLRGDNEEYRVLKSDAVHSGKGKGNAHPRTGHQDSEGSRGIALLFL
jgi:hypothetical protein